MLRRGETVITSSSPDLDCMSRRLIGPHTERPIRAAQALRLTVVDDTV
jgi:hypothetical protein